MKTSKTFLLFVSILFLFVLYPAVSLADWPLYRGDQQARAVAEETVRLPNNLKIRWEKRLEKDWFQATAVVVGNRIFIGSTDEGFWAFSLKDGKEIWKYSVEYGVLAPAAFWKTSETEKTEKKDEQETGLLLFGDSDGILHAVDSETGKIRWQFKTKGAIDNSPNIDQETGRVLIGSQDGSLYALEALSGKLVWEYQAGDQIRCFPTILGPRCFVAGCDSMLHVVDLDKGTLVTKIDLEAPTGSTPTVYENRLFFGTEGNEFLAVDWNTETQATKIAWRYKTQQAVRGPAACSDGLVVFCGMDRTVQALDIKTGETRWTFRTKGRMEHSGPVIVGNRIYVPSSDSFLYVLNLQTGEKLDAVELSGKLLASPAVVDNRVVIGTDDGVLFCLGE